MAVRAVVHPAGGGRRVRLCDGGDVLEVYFTDLYDERRPLVCLDEASKQLVGETVQPLPAEPGQAERFDYEYVRNGTANQFMITEPLMGWRHVEVTQRRTAKDFAEVLRCSWSRICTQTPTRSCW